MLEWATTLFLHMALNVHTWATATEIMLKHEGYAFNTSDSLHHHFNNALVHYKMLIQLVNAEVVQMVNAVPPPQMCHTETPTPPASFSHNQYCDSSTEHAPSLLPITLDESTPINGRKYQNACEPPAFGFDPKVPSNYLHSKCPCCFGSSFAERSKIYIVCSLHHLI